LERYRQPAGSKEEEAMVTLQRFRVSTSPVDTLFRFHREMDRPFRPDPAESGALNGQGSWQPPMDVVETAEAVLCLLELPSMRRDDVSITLEDNVLTVSGEKRLRRDGNQEGELRLHERRYGRFQRSLTLPRYVDGSQVRASFEDGLLAITLPKVEQARARQIPIESGARQHEIAS
jgi:HSP20 family protein